MKLLVLLALVAACKRESARQESKPAPPPHSDASTADAAAAAGSGSGSAVVGEVDLLHSIPTKVAVSSVVANPKITPFDLVDGDLATAWNSKTGQLVGAWIAFRVPPSARVTAVKLTAGFASKGPEGDYFTMNPRIKRVAIWHDGVKLREHDLDIASRELQSVPVGANGGDYKLEVVAIEPGEKKNWRETCVSELQVIGTPPPGMKITPGTSPEISVGSLDGKPLEERVVYLEPPPSFASVDDYCAQFKTKKPAPCEPWDQKCEKQPEANTCGGEPSDATKLPQLPAGWTGTWFKSKLGNAKRDVCNLALVAGGKAYVLEEVGDWQCGKPSRIGETPPHGASRHEVRVAELFGGGEPELALVMAVNAGDKDLVERLFLCTATAQRTPACTSATIGGLEHKTASGDDGYDEWHDRTWERQWALRDGLLDIHAPKGKPESYEEDVTVGKHRLRVRE